jgi:hypothetical protein
VFLERMRFQIIDHWQVYKYCILLKNNVYCKWSIKIIIGHISLADIPLTISGTQKSATAKDQHFQSGLCLRFSCMPLFLLHTDNENSVCRVKTGYTSGIALQRITSWNSSCFRFCLWQFCWPLSGIMTRIRAFRWHM